MKCRLCHQDRDLRWSHIIPEFCYASLYNEKHCFNAITTQSIANPKKLQKGKREQLLCDGCESKLSKYERYASQVLKYSKDIPILKNDFQGFEGIVDYKLFKLFQISILWRLGINSSFSPDCVLGKHELKLRRMLIDGDPGKCHEYGCALVYSAKDQQFMSDSIVPIGMSELGGTEFYVLALESLYWIFRVSDRRKNEVWANFYLQEDGRIRVVNSHTVLDGFWENQIALWGKRQRPR